MFVAYDNDAVVAHTHELGKKWATEDLTYFLCDFFTSVKVELTSDDLLVNSQPQALFLCGLLFLAFSRTSLYITISIVTDITSHPLHVALQHYIIITDPTKQLSLQ
jgi:hypothetical protein